MKCKQLNGESWCFYSATLVIDEYLGEWMSIIEDMLRRSVDLISTEFMDGTRSETRILGQSFLH